MLIFLQTVSDAADRRLQNDEHAQSHKDLLQGFLNYRDRHDAAMPLESVKKEVLGA